MDLDYSFENHFDATKYPDMDPELAAILEVKVGEMRKFMDNMKGGVRQMRSFIDFKGQTKKYGLKLL